MPTSSSVLTPPDVGTAPITTKAGSAAAGDRPPSRAARLANHGAVLVTPPRHRTFPGRPDQVAIARRFVGRMLDGCPVADTAILLASELVTNALQHTSTATGGTFDVIVWRGMSAACVAVLDDGSDSAPTPRDRDPLDHAESGYGLSLVDQLATRWGHNRYNDGTAVWFLLRWTQPASSAAPGR
jgi:anti-sigma regulatory factor (Ser/Thr protein kinase)